MDDEQEDDIDTDTPPFWLQQSTVGRRYSSSFGYILFLLFLLVVALAFIFITIPSFLSFTGQFFKPQSVKKSWDSLNLVLVIFAIVCAFLTKSGNNNQQTLSNSTSINNYHEDPNNATPTPSTPNSRWFGSPNPKVNRLSSGRSYPDLQSVHSWSNDNRYRFYDDTYVHEYRSDLRQQQPPPDFENVVIGNKEEIGYSAATAVSIRDKEVSPPPPSVPAPVIISEVSQLPELSKALVKRKARRRSETVSQEISVSENDVEAKTVIYLPPASPAPPSPPPPPPFTKNEKRRGKDFLISLTRKKRRQRQKSVDNLDSFCDPQAAESSYLQPPTPPPPPPFLQGFFSSKRSKIKKSHSISTTPQPQQPYTLVSKALHHSAPPSFETGESKTRHKINSDSAVEDHHHLVRGNAEPLIPIPPPPPPPPFNIPVWKYVVKGDYVRLQSLSRSASPELEDQSDKELSPMEMEGEDSPVKTPTPLICPSPDVNTKADNFIARFKEALRLEKEKSIKDRGKSNLGLEINGSPAEKGPR